LIAGGMVFLAVVGLLWAWDRREQRYWQRRIDEDKKRRSK
jgi:hypothetical protein